MLNPNEIQDAQMAITSVLTKSPRYYFTTFRIDIAQVKLSVFSTNRLPPELQKLKRKVGWRLIRFEDANVQLSPFIRSYALETQRFLFESVVEHYKMQLKNQAAKILGSVDFLGNPLGFVNNVSDGLNELINEGSVGGLILNVAHGISDSTAKFSSVLSNGLGMVTMDARHEEIRKRIRQESDKSHLVVGVKGLTVGFLGGVTSIISQTYEGVVTEGVPGLFFGLGKGLIGTITKPAVGMLDFATGAASAVRDTSRKISNSSMTIERIRPLRQNIDTTTGLIPKYNLEQAKGQEFFHCTNFPDKEDFERFVAFETLPPDSVVLITSDKVRFITWSNNIPFQKFKVQLTVEFERLVKCVVCSDQASAKNKATNTFIVPIITVENSSSSFSSDVLRPKIKCTSLHVAFQVCEQINYAKSAYEERKFIVGAKFNN